MQRIFSPSKYHFTWTDPKPGETFGWYTWDRDAAHKTARKERDDEAQRLKREGWNVKKFSLRNQLISRGGIGTPHPHIELVQTSYGINFELPV